MRMRNSTFFVYLLISICFTSHGFAQKAIKGIRNIKFQPVEGQLSENMVTDIVQDQKGFLWVGTRDGLNRYNGIDFYVYEHIVNDTTSLTSSFVNKLLMDNQGRLWVGTNDGLNLYNEDADNFKQFKYKDVFHDKVIRSLYQDSEENIWVGTERNGLIAFNLDNNKFKWFKHDKNDPGSLVLDNVQTIIENDKGEILVGTFGGGLDILRGNKFIHHKNNPRNPQSISSNIVRATFMDYDGNIWIGTKHGLNKIKDQNGKIRFEQYPIEEDIEKNNLVPDVITAIHQDCNGNLWIAVENKGLSVLDPESNTFIKHYTDPLNPNSITSNSIWKIFRDNVCTMWLAPRNQGLIKWDEYQIRFNHHIMIPTVNLFNNSDVTCFVEDGDGILWIGTDGGGLNYYDKNTGKYKQYLHDPDDPQSLGSNAVISLFEDSQGNLWVGTWEGGLNLFNKKTGKFRRYINDPYDPSTVSSNNIYAIYEDSKKRLWISAYDSGMDLMDRSTGTFRHIKSDSESDFKSKCNNVIEIFEDSKKNIWLGSTSGGLSKIIDDQDGNIRIESYDHIIGHDLLLGSSRINFITEDSKKRLWIGTFGGGLSCLNCSDNKVLTYRKSDGLPSNVVSSVLEDKDGNLWISTSNGISKFDPESEEFNNFFEADGLQSNEFLPGSCLKTKCGELYFGGVNGYNSFYPEQIKENPNIPPIYITNFRIYNEPVKPGIENSPIDKYIANTESITLDYNQNVFSFEFSALNYTQAEKNQYAYILEGYDKNWQYCNTRRNAYYTKVPPGTYSFRVRASNNDGYWNNTGTAVKVIINPPWYKTIWAYFIYFSLAVLLFIWYRQILIKRERLKGDLKLEHMELVKMQELDQVKSDFFANISHELRTPLTLILGPLKSLYNGKQNKDVKESVNLMIRNAEMLLRLINQLLDFSKIGAGKMKLEASKDDIVAFVKPILYSFESYAEKRHIKLFLNVDKPEIELYFDPDKMEKIMINLISNALKFTPEYGTIQVNLCYRNEEENDNPENTFKHILIQVQDSGIGIPEEHLDDIFDRFYQVKRGSESKNVGTGIGLSLTKQLVEMHKGKIKVKSKVNKGTVFDVYLLLGKDHLKDDEIVIKKLGKGNYNKPLLRESIPLKEVTIEKSIKDIQVSNSQLEENKVNSIPKVLIVEDNEDLRSYIASQLPEEFYVIEAKDGNEGLQSAINNEPHLIIMDVMMPGINGYELCNRLKKDNRTCHIPILMLTAKASEESQLKGFEYGADYYMAKPFDAKIFTLNVHNILSSRKAMMNKYAGGQLLTAEPGKIEIDPADKKFFKLAVECVEQNISKSSFGVKELGRELGVSRMQLYRKLKALTGNSANEFIREIRLKRAAQLLEAEQFTITQVMYNVGFNDMYYFRSCFKKKYGVNPSVYSKSLKNKVQ